MLPSTSRFVVSRDRRLGISFASDLAGYDLLRYDGSPESVVPRVMSWLISREEATAEIKPAIVLKAMPDFQRQKSELMDAWAGEVPWAQLLRAALEVARGL